MDKEMVPADIILPEYYSQFVSSDQWLRAIVIEHSTPQWHHHLYGRDATTHSRMDNLFVPKTHDYFSSNVFQHNTQLKLDASSADVDEQDNNYPIKLKYQKFSPWATWSTHDYQTLSRSNRSYPVPTLVDATQKSGKDNNNTSHVLHVETITPQEKNINHSEIPWIYLSTFYTFALSHSRRHHGNKYFVLFSICETLSPRNVAKHI